MSQSIYFLVDKKVFHFCSGAELFFRVHVFQQLHLPVGKCGCTLHFNYDNYYHADILKLLVKVYVPHFEGHFSLKL